MHERKDKVLPIHSKRFLKKVCFREVQLALIFFSFMFIGVKNRSEFRPNASFDLLYISLDLAIKLQGQNLCYQSHALTQFAIIAWYLISLIIIYAFIQFC